MADASPMPPGNPDPTFRGFLTGHDRVPLAFVRWEHPDPKGRVVLSHGYGEHSGSYRHTAQWLNGLGWSVSAMDHHGFGRSGGRRGDASGIRGFVEDLALFLRQERRHDADGFGEGAPVPPCPQVLLGHSFGGLLAALDLLWFPETVDGLILTSPAVAFRSSGLLLKILQRFMSLVAPHRTLKLPRNKDQVCSDPVLIRDYLGDPLCHHRASAAFAGALEQGRRELIPFGHVLDRPILLLEAADDTVVDPEGAEALWSAVKPGFLERHRLAGFKHEILHDLHRAEAHAIAEAWLNCLLEQWHGNPKALAVMFNKEPQESQ